MKCPKCGNEMTEVRKDISHNPENKKKYSRILYQCKKDDVWITVEAPE